MNNAEQLLLQRFLQGEGAWPQAVYLAGMFAVLLWRKDSVTSWALYRTSYLLYAASLILPPLITPFSMSLTPNRSIGSESQLIAWMVATGVWPLLFGAAVACALGSMMPRRHVAPPPPAPPPKHPLD